MSDNRHARMLVPPKIGRFIQRHRSRGPPHFEDETERLGMCGAAVDGFWGGREQKRRAACAANISDSTRPPAMVPLAGLEPARCRHQQILSLPRLPIPPQ